jgi:TadE-like protein
MGATPSIQRGASIATRGVATRGQAATETMIMMMFLLLMIFGLVHLCMLMSVKFMVNNAAFSAARTAMIAPNDASTAAEEGLGWMRGWWRGQYSGLNTPYVQGPVNKTIRGKNRNGYRATFAVPFGLPIFNTTTPCGFTNQQNCGIRLIGFSPYARQPNITHRGDND